jgi:hypothetical protein
MKLDKLRRWNLKVGDFKEIPLDILRMENDLIDIINALQK